MSQILQRMVGVQRARYMSLTGAKVDGATAYEWGLACAVVEPQELMPEVTARHCNRSYPHALCAEGYMRWFCCVGRTTLVAGFGALLSCSAIC